MTDKPTVWIATPLRKFEHRGVLTKEAFESLSDHYKNPIKELCSQPDLPWSVNVNIMGGGNLFFARIRIASDFMEQCHNPDDKLLMVDYDLMPTGNDYYRILSHDLPIVGGLYTIRDPKGHWVMNKMVGAAPKGDGTLKVLDLGTGFKCFKRSTFQKVLDANPWLNCQSVVDPKRRDLCFFSAGPVWDKQHWPGVGHMLTEDYWFDWLCRNEGIDTIVDTNVKIRHYDEDTKTITPLRFPPDPCDLPLETIEP